MKSICGKRLILPAKLDCLDAALDFVKTTLGQGGCPPKELGRIEVAVEEIFVNIVNYAYPGGEGDVTIRCDLLPGAARIRFTDSGMPYNPLKRALPDTALPADERPIGGLGIWIVRRTMDRVDYRHAGGKNILTIEKTLSGDMCEDSRKKGEMI